MSRASEVLRAGAMAAILLACFVRAMTADSGTPYWDLDPLLTNVPETTLLPSLALGLDALVWLGVAAAIAGEALAGRRVMWKSGVLVAIGAAGVLLHGLLLAPIGAPGLHGDFASLIRGSPWAAAMAGAWGMAHLARDPEFRRVAGAALLGFVVLLAGVGAYEYFHEHAVTVSAFDADPAAALAAQGMEPGTAAAMAFERRLRQPEAIAWFGLANVYGSFAAAGFVGWLGISIASRRARRGWITALCTATCLIAAGAVVMSGSKGAAAAAALGVGLVGLGTVTRGRALLTRWGGIVGIGAIALPLAAVAARGVLAQRIGELSLLFRAQYAIAALRIFADHPLLGVGPAGFKIAYATTKVPTNPEWVDSPHSLLLDWGSTLGLFGIAWIGAWLWWITRAGRALADTTDDAFHERPRSLARPLAVLAVLVAILLSWRLDMPTTFAGEMGVRAIAAALWVALLFAPLPITRAALGAAALTMAAHMQIEMAGVRTPSALPAMLLIGLAAAPAARPAAEVPRALRAPAMVSMALSGLIGLVIVAAGVVPLSRWESHLRRAAELVQASAPNPATPRAMMDAHDELLEADAILPSLSDPVLQAARLAMVVAQAAAQSGKPDDASRASSEAIVIGAAAGERFANDSVACARLAMLYTTRYALLKDRSDLEAAAATWERAAALDPLALTPAVQAWRLNAELGRTEKAAAWAHRALENDQRLSLDPVIQLPERMRTAIRQFLSQERIEAPRALSPSTPP